MYELGSIFKQCYNLFSGIEPTTTGSRSTTEPIRRSSRYIHTVYTQWTAVREPNQCRFLILSWLLTLLPWNLWAKVVSFYFSATYSTLTCNKWLMLMLRGLIFGHHILNIFLEVLHIDYVQNVLLILGLHDVIIVFIDGRKWAGAGPGPRGSCRARSRQSAFAFSLSNLWGRCHRSRRLCSLLLIATEPGLDLWWGNKSGKSFSEYLLIFNPSNLSLSEPSSVLLRKLVSQPVHRLGWCHLFSWTN